MNAWMAVWPVVARLAVIGVPAAAIIGRCGTAVAPGGGGGVGTVVAAAVVRLAPPGGLLACFGATGVCGIRVT